jgi:hypothetical protein
MPRKLTWNEVAAVIDRENAARYGRYLRGVIEGENHLPKPTAAPSIVNRMIVLGSVHDWCRRHHRHRYLLATVRAFSWCARFCYPFHPVFARLGLGSADVVEALEWIAADAYSFRFTPSAYSGAVLVGEHHDGERRELHYFSPVHLVAPGIDDDRDTPFRLRMAVRLVMEAALRAICVAEDDGNYDDIAIRITVRDLLEVAAPLVIPD